MNLEMTFNYIVLLTDRVSSCPNAVGSKGYGEGIIYGNNTFNRGIKNTYHYRFAGKDIPKEGIVYLTCESNHFSRVSGDKSQIIVTYDKKAKGFRLIEHIPAEAGG